MEVKLKWSDLYNNAANVLDIRPIVYPSGEPKILEPSQVDEISEIISKQLHVFDKHRNITVLQASFKITESKQTEKPCKMCLTWHEQTATRRQVQIKNPTAWQNNSPCTPEGLVAINGSHLSPRLE